MAPEDETEEPEVIEQTGPESTETEAPIPDNYAGLLDAARELEPSLKNSDTLPSGPTGPEAERGPDGKFLAKKDPLAAEVSGASGAEEQTGTTGATGPAARDADLEVKPDTHMRAPTRKVIDTFRDKAVAARNELEQANTRFAEVQKKLAEAEDKLKTIKAPKEMEEELTTLRTRVRELDISKDPVLQQKYDGKIKRNSETALGILKDNGVFSISQKEGPAKEMSEAEKKNLTAELEKSGFGIRGMAKYIKALEGAGEYEAAERLRQAAAETDRLGQEREQEIATWNKDYEGLQAQRTRESEAENQKYLTSVKQTAETTLQQDLTDLSKKFPFITPPAVIVHSDSSEVQATKQKALDAHKAATEALHKVVAEFNAEGLPPEKAAIAYGKLQAAAVQAVIIKQQVLPRLQKDLETANARVKELEAEVGKVRTAGKLNRAHSAAITAPQTSGKAPPTDMPLEQAMRQIAQEEGMKVD